MDVKKTLPEDTDDELYALRPSRNQPGAKRPIPEGDKSEAQHRACEVQEMQKQLEHGLDLEGYVDVEAYLEAME